MTKRGELPYHAAIGYNSKRRPGKKDYNCGGTLINRYISSFHVTVGRDWKLDRRPFPQDPHRLKLFKDLEYDLHEILDRKA